MGKPTGKTQVRIIKSRPTLERPISKADTTTQLTNEEIYAAGTWIEPPVSLLGLKNLVEHSTILPQCIRAYKNNIAGFGIGVRYIDDEEETPEMAAEFERMQEVISCLTTESDTKRIFEDAIEAREIYGIAYIEVIRNNDGEVSQVEFIRDTPSVRKTKPLDYQDVTYYHRGQPIVRKKRFRMYKQTAGDHIVYYKEFGDLRLMDNRTGEYLGTDGVLDAEYQANELLELPLGCATYGTVRWIGQILGVDGAWKAEKLNNNYFVNGRHTPLAIIVNGGTLTDESFEKLQDYMNEIRGENGQHAFLLLETESIESDAAFEADKKPGVELKDLAGILQKDELFQDYMENNRRKVQSAFQLPDLYVAYTTDFNRATAQVAQEVTEKQVFQPERASLAWILNNKLLNGYQFKHVEAYFKAPDISNPEDLYKLMTIANAAGGLTPNKAKDLLYKSLGEVSEDYKGEWGEEPLARSKQMQNGAASPNGVSSREDIGTQLEKSILKATDDHEDEIVTVLKEIRRQLEESGGDGHGQL